MKIFEKYFLREIFYSALFFYTVLSLFFIFLKLIDFSDKIIDGTLPFFSALSLTLFLIPSFSIFTIPLVCLSSILFTFAKFSSNNEIVALKSFGVSLNKIFKIPFFFGVALFIIGIINNIYIIPFSTKIFINKVENILHSSGQSLKPEAFNSILPTTVIYFKKINKKNKNLQNVFIYSKISKKPEIIVAKSGKIEIKNKLFSVNLKNGNIYIKKPEATEIISFEKYILKYDISTELGKLNINLKDKESSIQEIKKNIEMFRKKGNIKKVNYLYMEIYKRFSLPFASVIFVIIGAVFGIRNSRNPKSWTILILFSVVFLYYSTIMVANYLVKACIVSPFIGSWLPNLIVGGLTLVLFYFVNKEKMI